MKLGLNEDISNEDYHADTEFLSSSSLKMMLKAPREFYHRYVKKDLEEEEKPQKDSLVFGSLVHSVILEPHLVEKEYVEYKGASKRTKEWKEFKASNESLPIITTAQLEKANMMRDIAMENEFAVDLLKEGVPEQTLCVELEGVKIKVRSDYLKDGQIVDVKTTSDGLSFEEVQNTCLRWDYALSAALYTDSFSQYFGKKHDFYFVFLGKGPLGCGVFKASESFLEHGRKKYKRALKKIITSRETGVWFNEGIAEISLPEGILG